LAITIRIYKTLNALYLVVVGKAVGQFELTRTLRQNKTTLILTTIGFTLAGLLLIYRGQQTIDGLHKLSGTVTSLTIQEFIYKSGYRYSLDFGLKETEKVYGIYLGTKDQADRNELKNKIEINKTYTFYVDQTVTPDHGHVLGIRAIKNDGQTIYEENPKANYIGGLLFLTMGIGTLVMLIYWNRRKKK